MLYGAELALPFPNRSGTVSSMVAIGTKPSSMQNGADIILADMKEPDGAFAASCYAEGRQCTFVQVNLLDEESIVKMVAAARNVTGRIDILVNAAGVQTAAPSCMCWAFMWMAAWRSILRIRPI